MTDLPDNIVLPEVWSLNNLDLSAAGSWRRAIRELRKMVVGAERITSTIEPDFINGDYIDIRIKVPVSFMLERDEYALSVYEYALDSLKWYRLGPDAIKMLLDKKLISQQWADEIIASNTPEEPEDDPKDSEPEWERWFNFIAGWWEVKDPATGKWMLEKDRPTAEE